LVRGYTLESPPFSQAIFGKMKRLPQLPTNLANPQLT
jgi:hypothetical protein